MNKSDEPAVIQFQHVTKRYGARVALEDVTLELRRGSTLGIVGESGSGKSTCVRLAVGLERPTSGGVLWEGSPFPTGRRGLKAMRRKIGIVFQDPYDSLDARMPIAKIVAEPLRTHGIRGKEATEKVRQTLDAVGMANVALDSYPARYSGGGRQRIAIARGIVLEPEVLLCDEPTASLDVSVQAQIANLLVELKENRGISTVFVSHDLDLVHRVADDTVVMYAGRVMEVGTAEQIRDHPRHPYTRMLLAASPGDHPRNRKLGSVQLGADAANIDRGGCVFADRCPIVQDVCRHTEPPLERLDDNTHVACLFPLGASPTAQLARRAMHPQNLSE